MWFLECACAKLPPGYYSDEDNVPFNPIATNGEPYPWLLPDLPTNIRPIQYILTLHPNLTNLDVKGQITIDFVIERETNFIVLHVQDLNITEKAIITPKGYALRITRMLEFPPRQQLYLEIKDKFRKKVNYTLNLRWNAKLSTVPEGFFVDSYEGRDGSRTYLAAAVFGPGGARRAFPCFDEPHLRAPFRISIFRDRFHLGLSNSIVHSTDDVGFYMGTGLLRDDFFDTPPLPPDSVAWVVSGFNRTTLESSAAYQVATTTTARPTTTEPPTTTVRPVRSKSAMLTKSFNLFGIWGHPNSNSNENLAQTVVDQALVSRADNGPKATSYTFYCAQEYIENGKDILLISRRILEFFQPWLDVQYPLSKLGKAFGCNLLAMDHSFLFVYFRHNRFALCYPRC